MKTFRVLIVESLELSTSETRDFSADVSDGMSGEWLRQAWLR